ncbi:TPA: hypothetical protein ACX6QL_003596 [Photobacterium damselae]
MFEIHGPDSFKPHNFAKNAQTKLQTLEKCGRMAGLSTILFSSPVTLSVWLKQYKQLGIQGIERSRGRTPMRKPPYMGGAKRGISLLTSRECCSKKVRRTGAGKVSPSKEKVNVALALKSRYPLQQWVTNVT